MLHVRSFATRVAPLFTAVSARLFATFAVSLAACGGGDAPPAKPPAAPATRAAVSSAPSAKVGAARSVDLSAIDRSTRPGADFFLYANGAWIAQAEIPPDRGWTGTSVRSTEEVEMRTHGLLEEASRANAKGGAAAQKLGDFYASYLDEAGIEKRGVAPLAPLLQQVTKIDGARALATYLGSTLRVDVDPLNMTHFATSHVFGLFVEQDLNDPSRVAPYLLQGGLGLSDRSYYLDDAPRMQSIRTAYTGYLTTVLRLAGVANPEAKVRRALALEKKIAETHGKREDSGDVAKANNPWARGDFASKAPGLDWNAYFVAAGLDREPSFIVWHPHAITGIAALVKSEPLAAWKDYLTVRAVDRAARFLPKGFGDAHFAFYDKQLRGSETPPPRWRSGADLTTSVLGDALGKAYVEKYFPPETKRAVADLVTNIVAAFGRRIDALTWMTPATKIKAKEKLATLKVSVGYPDVWRDDTELSVDRADLFGNMMRAELFAYRHSLRKLGHPPNRDEWAIAPHVIGAVNLPVRNALNFPAGMLSAPYFDPEATAAANYGGIGAIIGHEVSHSFDDMGAEFDAKGRFANWWTPEDFAHFQASSAALVAQYNAYKPLPDASLNGKLTLGENIADLAGLAVSYDAWRASLGGGAAPVHSGLSGDQQFFLAYAQTYQTKAREASLRWMITSSEHAPPHQRVLTVRNLDAWYTAFDVAPSDPLFLSPNARVRVW